ncbi:MAG: helix-turn-helix transcriptional regulator [Clostridiales bacterium]|nr:helix-turn-helix transcriptional regulator [Candidatus Cacconaster stercorequi]
MNNLKSLRAAAGLTQQQLADASGVSRQQIAKIESGIINIENISLRTALALSSALCVRAEDLTKSTP